MKKILTSETFLGIIVSIVFSFLIFLGVMWATAPEQWYAGMHDSKCEKTFGDSEECKCYERLLESDKARCRK